jgi:transcriptional regulator with XRE-family HTH domain
MAYTSFGEFLRILRIKHHEVMGDMAKVLNVKVPFLSAVENGKKNVPIGWIDIIARHYNLSESEKRSLEEAAEESRTQYKIVTEKSGLNQRRAALRFARSFDDLDDETALKILELLNQKEGH